ncbi:hypothetical protein I7I48_01298 [Histoplasma ohiense]|nr:hypothetical protein I7I48_01298 [Histoplasma ohiense (nom. inval.)]
MPELELNPILLWAFAQSTCINYRGMELKFPVRFSKRKGCLVNTLHYRGTKYLALEDGTHSTYLLRTIIRYRGCWTLNILRGELTGIMKFSTDLYRVLQITLGSLRIPASEISVIITITCQITECTNKEASPYKLQASITMNSYQK